MNVLLDMWYTIFRKHTFVQPRAKLKEEVEEFLEADSKEEQLREGADVMIVVLTQLFMHGYTFEDVQHAVEYKLGVNINRVWERQPDGTIHHI